MASGSSPLGTAADGDVHDLGDVALLPGLVNAHTHLEFSYLKQPLGEPGMRLADWIRLVIAERGRGDTSPLVSNFAGLREVRPMRRDTLGDIATNCFPAEFETIDQQTFVEVIGFSRARAPSSLSNLIGRLDEMQRTLRRHFRRAWAWSSLGNQSARALYGFAGVVDEYLSSWRRYASCRWRCIWRKVARRLSSCATAQDRFRNCSKSGACGTRRRFRAEAGRWIICGCWPTPRERW